MYNITDMIHEINNNISAPKLDFCMRFVGYKKDLFGTSIKLRDGDICLDGNKEYIYYNGKWEELGKCDLSNNTKPQPKKITYPTNCKNCGAVMRGYWCDYCGSSYPMYEEE